MSLMVCLSRCWCARVNVYLCACPCKSKHVSECVSVTVCVSTCFCLYVHECVQVIVHLYERGFAGMTGRTCMLACVYLCANVCVYCASENVSFCARVYVRACVLQCGCCLPKLYSLFAFSQISRRGDGTLNVIAFMHNCSILSLPTARDTVDCSPPNSAIALPLVLSDFCLSLSLSPSITSSICLRLSLSPSFSLSLFSLPLSHPLALSLSHSFTLLLLLSHPLSSSLSLFPYLMPRSFSVSLIPFFLSPFLSTCLSFLL